MTRRRVGTVLAGLVVLAVLLLPSEPDRVGPAAFLALPVEAVVGAAVVLLLPRRARRVVLVVAGVLLGLLCVGKLLDLGFGLALGRPFDPLADWTLIGPARDLVSESFGAWGAVVLIGLVLLAVGVPVLLLRLVLRLGAAVADHRVTSRRAVLVLGSSWALLAATDLKVAPGMPVAARTTARTAYDRSVQVTAQLGDRAEFARASASDAYADTPADRLLTGLRGKDVLIVFVESYGRVAVDDPRIAPTVGAALVDGALGAAGLGARSAFLTAPAVGGQSWLAHATLQSGLRIDDQLRYGSFTSSDRLTLAGAFHRAGWRTVGVAPGNDRNWPEGRVYGYDQVYDARTLGYAGPRYSFSSVPDQFTLAAFQRRERTAAGRRPVLAEIDLISSHAPWSPVPELVDWDELGDGAGFAVPRGADDSPRAVLSRDRDRVLADYARSIAYSLTAVGSYLERYGDDDLVLVLLGDHQPAAVITGPAAGADVPVTVLARDPAVLERIDDWGWTVGTRPGPQAPVWSMEDFRDRFLAAYGPVS